MAPMTMADTETIAFNTGRQYAEDGQSIRATLHRADMTVTFYDRSRDIDGEFKLCGGTFDQAVVMDAYDSGVAQGTRRSRLDALPGGCNAH
jgi:hypothetical protein